MSKDLHIFILAGESSGDRLGAALMKRLRQETGGAVTFSGVGGEAMISEGLQPVFPMRDIAVMGLIEVVPHLKRLRERLNYAVDTVRTLQPDAVITIDAQVFSGLLAKRIKRLCPSTKLIHYVAPTVWAWKPWRARKLAGYLDRVLALFPFEPPFFEKEGLSCDFVGHPVVEHAKALPPDAGQTLRSELGFYQDAKVLLIAPGSRLSEIQRLGKPFCDAVTLLSRQLPDLEFILAVAGNVAGEVKALPWPERTRILDPGGLLFAEAEKRKFSAFATADAALLASGTVSLELAAFRVPMIVGYKMPKMTEFIARRIMTINTGTLVNIIAGKKIVPEYWQDDCNGQSLADALSVILNNEKARNAQIAGFNEAFRTLGETDTSPSQRAAHSVLDVLKYHS